MKIIILGAGVIGLFCAWRLAQRGAAVEIYDPRSPGHGASLAALGALWPPSPLLTGPLQELQRQSLWQFQAFAEELSTHHPVPFNRLGRLELLTEKTAATAAQEVAAANAQWPQFASAPTMQILSPEQAEQCQPHLHAPHGVLLCRATAHVSVQDLTQALVLACQKAGVILHEKQSPPANLLSNIRAHADALLLTAGAWTPLVDPLLAAVPIRPVKGQALALGRPPNLPIPHILKSGPTYLIPTPTEILVGSTTEPEAAFDESPTQNAREKLFQAAAALLPLQNAPILRHWAGLRPQNPAKPHLPLMGPLPSNPNIFLAVGHFKTGIALAPLVSRLIAAMILENRIPPELLPFQPR